jgi:hypothetical protein
MPVLTEYLRRYGIREYLSMLAVAVVCGLGIAALINASSSGAQGGAPIALKTKAQLDAERSRVFTTRVSGPAAERRPARRHRARHHRRAHVRRHHRAAAAPRLVAVRKPAPAKALRPAVAAPRAVPQPVYRPAPRPVVSAPRPAPRPAPAPKRGGGSQAFDDSG